ncbi:MAG TPA: DoxX family membrane protein [Verrucomicrobiae bacterium]|nr:DoxX family membrane protein [Verrucomicrobiae bacterium]
MEPVDAGLVLLRLVVGLTFAAHGAQKAFGWWGGPGWERWHGAVASMGFRPSRLFAVISTGVELLGGLCLALGLLTPLAAAALLAQSAVIVVKVHAPKGFFNTRGGIEFPLALATTTFVIGFVGPGAASLDGAAGFSLPIELRLILLFAGLAGGLLTIPLAETADRPSTQS